MKNESLIRLTFFLTIFILMAGWEIADPLRPRMASKAKRWVSNLTLVFLNTVIVRLLFSTTAVGMALLASKNQWGIFNLLAWPPWLKLAAATLALDFALYLQHLMFHAVPFFWRFHMMHHADLDVDVTTGARFHPIEIMISMVIKLALVFMIGAPPLAVLVFEIVLNGTSMFNHSNVRISERLDRFLRWWLVTPDMHRIHHSVIREETNSNFGFNVPWWDCLLGTYRADPANGQTGMTIGLHQFRDPDRLSLPWMLALPFIGSTGEYPLNDGEQKQKN